MEVKQLHEEMVKTFGEMKTMLDRQDAEAKKHGEASAETKTVVDKLNGRVGELDTKITAQVAESEKKLTDRIGALEAKGTRLAIEPDPSKPRVTEAKTAFLSWCRYGDQVTPEERKHLIPWTPGPEERRALAVGNPTAAGYLAPTEYVREILKGIIEFSPIRGIARVRPTSAKAIQVPKRTGVFAGVWVAEQGTRAETTGLTFGLEEIPTHEAYALVDVSNQQLEDSAFDIEALLNEEFSEQFGVLEGAAFVGGNGVNKPEGFTINAATVAGATVTATNDVLAAVDFMTAFYALKDGYARNGTWVMRRATIGLVRKLVGTDGNFLWQPGLSGGQPSTILDRPYVEALDMPAVADGAEAVAFGDFKRGYVIVDRVDIAVTRDPFTQAASGNVRFHARKRVGGQVVNAEAIELITIQ